jgi:2-oxoglutarate dehydrogenase E1 component
MQESENAAPPVPDEDSLRALMFIHAVRSHGHLAATTDPLGRTKPAPVAAIYPSSYGFAEKDMDRSFHVGGAMGLSIGTMREIRDRLYAIYCGSIGVEFMHIQDPAQKWWIQERMENGAFAPESEKKAQTLRQLTEAEVFEQFLQTKYPATQRYSLEGAESFIPAIETAIETASSQGLSEAIIGMAHRGRLNLLANVVKKPFVEIFSEFQGAQAYPESIHGSGDIKYHLGASVTRDFGGHLVHLSLTANPSHLEAVDPVVLGRVRAKQQQISRSVRVSNEALRRVVGILIHGDAAMAAQGVVAETFMLSELKGYRTGGTIHIVVNNQIGFTTHPKHARSGIYCTDVAKMAGCPIFHVNGDDVDAVVRVAALAAAFRQTFLKDVVIDIVCYRRNGHNETDDPSFTQPLMYGAIKALSTTRKLYAEKLAGEGVMPREEAEAAKYDFENGLERAFRSSLAYKPDKADWLDENWKDIVPASGEERSGNTGVDLGTLKRVGERLTAIPAEFHLHPKLADPMQARRLMVQTGQGIDWAMAEALAFGSLLVEGTPVRLSGEDCKRGAFAQRHAVLFDQEEGASYTPLRNLSDNQATVEIHDSPLSEFAVLGFDYGFSLVDPNGLVLWEAQFGDFANGAQVIIDNFLSSAESKWLRMSGLVLLLPHGYEGQGAEHSSARVERYLVQSAEDNWQVVNCTTPANYFHVLRRQIRREFRKPLILLAPKSLLRHPRCLSRLDEMEVGTKFHRVLGEQSKDLVEDRVIRRVVICSGKVYYDLLAMREERKMRDVALIRIEELYPFPARPLAAELLRYPRAEVIWCQEEPANMGPWAYMDRRIEAVLAQIGHEAKRPTCVARPESAAPACGSLTQHQREQAELVRKALVGF